MILNPFASYADDLGNNVQSEFTDNEPIIINEDSINNIDLSNSDESIENQESFIESKQNDTNQMVQKTDEDEPKNENETNNNQEDNNINDTKNPDNFTETELDKNDLNENTEQDNNQNVDENLTDKEELKEKSMDYPSELIYEDKENGIFISVKSNNEENVLNHATKLIASRVSEERENQYEEILNEMGELMQDKDMEMDMHKLY